jgi:hypothetical protein
MNDGEVGSIKYAIYLGVPEMRGEIVGLLPELERDDFVHFGCWENEGEVAR